MDTNENLATISNSLFGGAFTAYLIGLILLVFELTSHRTKLLDAKAEELVSVGAGRSVPADGDVPGVIATVDKSGANAARLGRIGLGVVGLGWVLHVSSIVFRSLATHRAPWGNMYEFVTICTAAAILVALITLGRKADLRPVLPFVIFPALILMFVAGKLLFVDAGPVVPSLKSYWLIIHVSIVSIGSGIMLVSGVASLMFLLRIKFPAGSEPEGRIGAAISRLPSAQALDRVAYRTIIVAFPLFGLGVIFGAIWAEEAWGRFWGWDPKETFSFITWVVYAAYLHARATAGWRDKRAAYINIAGFAAMIFNLFIINYVVSGLHSYKG